MYKVYLLGEFNKSFTTRDNALAYVMMDAKINNRSTENYEILDGSDN